MFVIGNLNGEMYLNIKKNQTLGSNMQEILGQQHNGAIPPGSCIFNSYFPAE